MWPSGVDYDDALSDPEWCFRIDRLKDLEFVWRHNSFTHSSGNFAIVTRARDGQGRNLAVRFLIKEQHGLIERYRSLANLPDSVRRYFAPAEFIEDAVRVPNDDRWYPVMTLDWLDGETLETFVRQLCAARDVDGIEVLRARLACLRQDLRRARVAHGDVSSGNIMVQRLPTGDLHLTLIDYDSIWMPETSDLRCHVGVGGLQHPKRSNPIGEHADLAAFAIIDAALECFATHPELAERANFDNAFLLSASDIINGRADLLSEGCVTARLEQIARYLEGAIEDESLLWIEDEVSSTQSQESEGDVTEALVRDTEPPSSKQEETDVVSAEPPEGQPGGGPDDQRLQKVTPPPIPLVQVKPARPLKDPPLGMIRISALAAELGFDADDLLVECRRAWPALPGSESILSEDQANEVRSGTYRRLFKSAGT